MISDVGERVYLSSEASAIGPGRSKKRHDISVISAPVFDHYQRQVMVTSLHIGKALTDKEITECAHLLMATADTVTTQLGGTKPQRRAQSRQ
jgi:hypothetical protein